VKLSSFFAWTRTTRCRWSTTSSASPSAPLCSDVSSSIQPSFQRARLCAPSALVLVHLPSTPVLWARPFLSRSFSTCCATSTLRFPKTLHRRMNDYAQSYIVCPSVAQKNCTSKFIVDYNHTPGPPLTQHRCIPQLSSDQVQHPTEPPLTTEAPLTDTTPVCSPLSPRANYNA
jgi:hypothetical protein